MDNNLNTKYKTYINTPSDINELLPILKKYAEECKHITEFGTRDGISTVALLSAIPNVLITYDINRSLHVDELYKLAMESLINFNFIQKNVLEIEIEETDLLFIDTIHTYSQLSTELLLHANKVRKFIICHDTEIFGYRGCYGTEPGLMKAINEFINTNNNWKIKEILYNNNGLTILEKN